MPELSLKEFNLISRDVSRQSIVFSHLADDLLDHICCDVENEMQKGLTFSDAYRKVRSKIGSFKRLKEIQEETLYAVDTKYRIMRNTMKLSAIAGTIIFGAGVIFKIQHWPGAGIMLTIGALVLALFFMPSALVVLWKETQSSGKLFLFFSGFLAGWLFIAGTLFKIQHWPVAGVLLLASSIITLVLFLPALLIQKLKNGISTGKKTAYITGTLGIIFYMSGMIFKIQHWPLATILLVTGMISLALIAIPLYTISKWKEETHVSTEFIFLLVGVIIIAVPGALINLNLQKNYETGFYTNIEKQEQMNMFIYRANSSFIESQRDSSYSGQLMQLRTRSEEVLNLLDKTVEILVRSAETDPVDPEKISDAYSRNALGTFSINYYLLKNPFNPGPARNYLSPGTEIREEIDKTFKTYVLYLNQYPTMEGVGSELNPESLLPEDNMDEDRLPLLTALYKLRILTGHVLTTEALAQKKIAGLN